MRLCDVCDFQGGSQPPKNEWSFEQKDGYIRMLQIRDFTQTRNVEKEYIKLTSSTKTCVTEDILIARYGASIGKILTGLSGAYNVAIMKTIPNEGILNKSYLKYYLLSNYFQNGINSVGARAAQAGFNKEDLSKLYIPVVSLVQQKLIVDKLNKLTTFIGKRKTQLEKLDELVKSRFIELFGDPMTDVSKWSTSTIGEQFNVTSGGTPATGEKAYWESGTIPWIGSNMCQDTILSENDGKFITEEGYTHSSAKWFHKGTVLVALVGATIGKTALLRFDTTTNQNIAAIDVNDNAAFSSEFVFYHMQMLYSKFMEIGSGKFKMANQGFIRQLPLICPPIELQNQFAAFVEQTDKSKFEIKQSLEKLELLKKALMQKYFG